MSDPIIPDDVFEVLRQNPGQMYIHPNGKVLITLADAATDQFIAIKAQDGENFLTMSEEVINHYFCQVLQS